MSYLEYFNFCPQCGEYSGISFNILTYGDSPPDSELLKCKLCGWVGHWKNCLKYGIEREEKNEKQSLPLLPI